MVTGITEKKNKGLLGPDGSLAKHLTNMDRLLPAPSYSII